MSELPPPSLPGEQNTTAPQSVPTPILSAEPQALSPTPHHKKRIIFIMGAAMVGISAVAGLAYAAWAGYLPNPFVKRPSAENFLAALESMQSAQTSITIHVALKPQEDDVTPLDFSIFQDKTNEENKHANKFTLLTFVKMLPSDLELNLNVDSSFSKTADASTNEETHSTGTYTGNNISANLDLTTRTVDGVSYIKPDAIPLPIPLFDMSVLEGKWINLSNKEEDRDVFTMTFHEPEVLETDEKEKPDTLNELFVLLKQGVDNGAIIFSIPERVTYNSNRAWKTNVVIDGEKFRDTIISIGQNRDTLFPNEEYFTIFTNDFITAVQKERAKDIFREFFARTTFSGILNDDSSPVSLSFSTRIAPKLEDATLKNHQITFETSIDFAHINEPLTVKAPEDAISTSQAGALLLGKSAESITSEAQRGTIMDLREALDMYYTENNAYPESLNDLIGIGDDVKKVVKIPLDAITGEPYIYKATKDSYTLKYELSEARDSSSSIFEATEEGTNTATELFFSEEGAKTNDYDEDGLSEYDETVTYGTNDRITDSDGDGYNDKAEIDAGYNPNGEGLLAQ